MLLYSKNGREDGCPSLSATRVLANLVKGLTSQNDQQKTNKFKDQFSGKGSLICPGNLENATIPILAYPFISQVACEYWEEGD